MRFVIVSVTPHGEHDDIRVKELYENYRYTEMLVIPSEDVYKQYVDEVKNAVDELNLKYPETKKMECCSCCSSDHKIHDIFIYKDGEKLPLLTFYVKKIRGTYDGKKNTNAPERE